MSMNKHFRVYVPKIIGGLLLLLAVGYVIKIIMGFIDEAPKHQKKIQPITLVAPPPPPPPPPKVEPPPPEIEKVEQKLDEPEPDPEPLPDVPDEQPAGDTGLDAEGVAGSDAFGLAARKGGRGLLGGGGGDPNKIYASVVKNSLLDFLSDNEDLRRKAYYAVIKLWVNPDGTIDRFELAQGSKDSDIDRLLNKQLAKFRSLKEAPPVGMEQPIKLKISSRI